MKRIIVVAVSVWISAIVFAACEVGPPKSDQVQAQRMEALVAEGVAQVGAPAIRNFTELRAMKELYELRDQANLVTYTYIENQIPQVVPGITALGGKLTFLCTSVGYGLPYGTQFSNPMKLVRIYSGGEYYVTPQAEPNGLFMPPTAEGTWVKCKDPNGGPDVKPVLVESRGIYSPFKYPFDK